MPSSKAYVPKLANPALELERNAPLEEAAIIAGISEDGLKRHYSHLIRRLSPRRVAMKVKDAIAIGTSTQES
jgi:hypothetical protein